MARSRNGLSRLLSQTSSKSFDGRSLSRLLEPINLVSQLESGSKSTRIPASGDSTRLSLAGKSAPTGIQFGRPSRTSSSSSQSSSVVTGLLKQTLSGGLASFLGGGLGSITGLGGLVSGLTHLFGGGKSTPPPLVEFQLPDSNEQTVYVSSKGSTTYQGTSVEQAAGSSRGTGAYINSNPAGLQYQSSQIADAVKKALLNSSSLNDVIAEI